MFLTSFDCYFRPERDNITPSVKSKKVPNSVARVYIFIPKSKKIILTQFFCRMILQVDIFYIQKKHFLKEINL